ncbi:hypothetical protein [Streptomyces sp. NBC_00094]|uniref:hypothetical protein n=1 Tax=Streptomyces sp. NBC_00094 TaxID=2903620 RepID=UPI0022523A78|nr:hypothetical protein [Streptomyces sp. NBC_00094]MCX5390692.1 hypothetical protein [Streptomyces sp. NBC_00094]
MNMENPPPPALIRIPVRIVVLLVVLPIRMTWDALKVAARFLDRTLLRPAGRGLAWLLHHLVTRPGRWLYRHVLAPVGRGIAWALTGVGRGLAWGFTRVGRGLAWVFTGLGRGLAVVGRGLAAAGGWLWSGLSAAGLWLGKALFVWPWVGLWRYVVVPIARYGIAAPARWLYRHVLAPLGTAALFLLEKLLLVPVAALFRYVVVPLFRYGIALPAVWLDRHVLTPLGHGIGWILVQVGRGLAWFFPRFGRGLAVVLVWSGRAVFVWPWVGLWRYVLVPVARYGIAIPATWVWKRVLVPVGREIRDALAICWRVAGFLSRAVGRALKWVAWNLVGRPVAWAWTQVVRPVGRWVRDSVLAPARRAAVDTGRAVREALAAARATVREARRDAWRALVGGARMTEPGEPEVARARTLGSTTNVPGAAPAPEISLRKRG